MNKALLPQTKRQTTGSLPATPKYSARTSLRFNDSNKNTHVFEGVINCKGYGPNGNDLDAVVRAIGAGENFIIVTQRGDMVPSAHVITISIGEFGDFDF